MSPPLRQSAPRTAGARERSNLVFPEQSEYVSAYIMLFDLFGRAWFPYRIQGGGRTEPLLPKCRF